MKKAAWSRASGPNGNLALRGSFATAEEDPGRNTKTEQRRGCTSMQAFPFALVANLNTAKTA
jgi:hypothetical protein